MRTHNLIHRSDCLHADAGTFYSNYYEDSERIFSLFDSYCWTGQLLLEDALDTARLFYRHQIPPLHRDLFFPVTITEQDYLEGRQRFFYYGDEGVRFGSLLQYGRHAHDIAGIVPLPSGIVDVDICTDIPVDPSVVLLQGVDFEIRRDYLVFYRNLFDVFPSEGLTPNRTCTFYLRSAYSDRKYLQNRLGVLTRTHGQSTDAYRDFCNLIVDSIIEGTSAVRLVQIICRLFGVPCTDETETVEVLDRDCLVTDKRVYFSATDANFLYKVGDTLLPGTVLTDAISVINHKRLPESVPLFLERRFLGSEYLAGLYFPNEVCRITYNTVASKLCFPIIGRQEDVDKFWQTFHERAVDADLLEQASLGGWINPAEFIYENVLYPRVCLFLIDINKTGERLPLVNTKILRSLLPPGVLFSLQMSMPPVPKPEVSISVRGRAGQQGTGMIPLAAKVLVFGCETSIRQC